MTNNFSRIFIIILLSLTGCTVDNDYIIKKGWKWGGGYYLGDVLYFDNSSLKNDTLFGKDSAYAIIYKTENRIIDCKIYIKCLKTGEIGTYYDKFDK